MFGKKGIFDNLETSLDNQSGIEMPVRFYRAEMFISYFEANLELLKALIPHERMHPIRRSSGVSVIAIIQTYCNHGSNPPFIFIKKQSPVQKLMKYRLKFGVTPSFWQISITK